MISSQKGREFVNSNYNDIKRAYSIWVCMNMSQNCMNYIHFTQESVVGTYQWKGDIRKGCGAEQISDLLDMEVEQVREIIENE